MAVYREVVRLETREGVQAYEITGPVRTAVRRSGIQDGIACVFTPSSTAAIIANEYEPGLREEDVPGALGRLFPESIDYGHERRWGDGNGHSHVRATFLGPSVSFPIVNGDPALGTWQQLVFLELDNKPRRREVLVQIVGEPDRDGRPRDK